MKRSPMPDRNQPLRRTPMRWEARERRTPVTARLSASRRDLARSHRIVRKRSGGVCELDGQRRATEIHHRTPRGMGGSSRSDTIHAPSNLVDSCSACHVEAESLRGAALRVGMLVLRGRATTEAPLFYRGQWSLLDDFGGVTAIPATTEAGRVRMCICGHPGSEHPTAQTCRGGGPHYSCHCWLFWAAADSGNDPT